MSLFVQDIIDAAVAIGFKEDEVMAMTLSDAANLIYLDAILDEEEDVDY